MPEPLIRLTNELNMNFPLTAPVYLLGNRLRNKLLLKSIDETCAIDQPCASSLLVHLHSATAYVITEVACLMLTAVKNVVLALCTYRLTAVLSLFLSLSDSKKC